MDKSKMRHCDFLSPSVAHFQAALYPPFPHLAMMMLFIDVARLVFPKVQALQARTLGFEIRHRSYRCLRTNN